MDITRIEDLAALRHFHAIESAVQDHDHVALPADPIEELMPHLRGEDKAGERILLFLSSVDSTPLGTVSLRLPTLDNLIAANLDLSVHPDHRRHGYGRALLQFGIAEVQRHGRSRVYIEVASGADGSEGQAVPLMKEMGARPVLDDYRRLLDFRQHPVVELHPVPDGYRVLQWVDRAPDEVVDGVSYLMGRMAIDAPMGEMDYEPEKWDVTRYREQEDAVMACGRIRVATVVVHVDSGTVAGLTDIGVNRRRPQIAYQWQTIVDPLHRGHRLGMVLKTWNHKLLRERVPDAAFINTWNAASNTFMVTVNDALGYRPVERWTEYQLDL